MAVSPGQLISVQSVRRQKPTYLSDAENQPIRTSRCLLKAASTKSPFLTAPLRPPKSKPSTMPASWGCVSHCPPASHRQPIWPAGGPEMATPKILLVETMERCEAALPSWMGKLDKLLASM